MSEELNESQELEAPVEDTTSENNEVADVEPQGDELKTALAQKKHWRDKAVDPKTGKTYKVLLDEARAKPQQSDNRIESVVEDLTDLKLGQRGLDEDSARFVKTYAKGLGKTALEVLEDETIKDYLASRKARQDHENSVPDPSSRTITVGAKPLSEMTDKEMKANWNSVVKAASRR